MIAERYLGTSFAWFIAAGIMDMLIRSDLAFPVSIPRFRSESPAFDLRHPEIAVIELEDNDMARVGGPVDAPDMEGRGEHVTDTPDGNRQPKCRDREKERGNPRNERKASGRLVEGQVTTNWKKALAQLALAYPDRIEPYL